MKYLALAVTVALFISGCSKSEPSAVPDVTVPSEAATVLEPPQPSVPETASPAGNEVMPQSAAIAAPAQLPPGKRVVPAAFLRQPALLPNLASAPALNATEAAAAKKIRQEFAAMAKDILAAAKAKDAQARKSWVAKVGDYRNPENVSLSAPQLRRLQQEVWIEIIKTPAESEAVLAYFMGSPAFPLAMMWMSPFNAAIRP